MSYNVEKVSDVRTNNVTDFSLEYVMNLLKYNRNTKFNNWTFGVL